MQSTLKNLPPEHTEKVKKKEDRDVISFTLKAKHNQLSQYHRAAQTGADLVHLFVPGLVE